MAAVKFLFMVSMRDICEKVTKESVPIVTLSYEVGVYLTGRVARLPSEIFFHHFSGFDEVFALCRDFEPSQGAFTCGVPALFWGVKTDLLGLQETAALLHAFGKTAQQALKTFTPSTLNFDHRTSPSF